MYTFRRLKQEALDFEAIRLSSFHPQATVYSGLGFPFLVKPDSHGVLV